VQQVEQLDRAGLERQAGRSKLPEVSSPCRNQGLERIVRAVVTEQEGGVHLVRTADELKEDVMAHRAADFGCGGQDCLGIKPFAVEQQTVHVEDDGCRLSGKLHRPRAAISALASSTKPAPDRAVVIQRGRGSMSAGKSRQLATPTALGKKPNIGASLGESPEKT